ncbi:hypothetical protein [Halioglobus japonicus]|nr:hypothetical protein [Halioglobus japonicus]
MFLAPALTIAIVGGYGVHQLRGVLYWLP